VMAAGIATAAGIAGAVLALLGRRIAATGHRTVQALSGLCASHTGRHTRAYLRAHPTAECDVSPVAGEEAAARAACLTAEAVSP
jgi:hypothetical protein